MTRLLHALVILIVSSTSGWTSPASRLVEKFAAEVLIKDRTALTKSASQALVEKNIGAFVDLASAAKSVLSDAWGHVRPEDRPRVVAAFRSLLARTIARNLEQHPVKRATILGLRPDENGGEFVIGRLVFDRGPDADVVWQVQAHPVAFIDIVIQGISVNDRLRQELSPILDTGDISDLSQKMGLLSQ